MPQKDIHNSNEWDQYIENELLGILVNTNNHDPNIVPTGDQNQYAHIASAYRVTTAADTSHGMNHGYDFTNSNTNKCQPLHYYLPHDIGIGSNSPADADKNLIFELDKLRRENDTLNSNCWLLHRQLQHERVIRTQYKDLFISCLKKLEGMHILLMQYDELLINATTTIRNEDSKENLLKLRALITNKLSNMHPEIETETTELGRISSISHRGNNKRKADEKASSKKKARPEP